MVLLQLKKSGGGGSGANRILQVKGREGSASEKLRWVGEVAIEFSIGGGKQQELSHEDWRGRAVFGKVPRVRTPMCLEERGKVGLRGEVLVSYEAEDCRLYSRDSETF